MLGTQLNRCAVVFADPPSFGQDKLSPRLIQSGFFVALVDRTESQYSFLCHTVGMSRRISKSKEIIMGKLRDQMLTDLQLCGPDIRGRALLGRLQRLASADDQRTSVHSGFQQEGACNRHNLFPRNIAVLIQDVYDLRQ